MPTANLSTNVLVCEDMYPVQTELYLGAVVDRSTRRVTFMASTEGGVEIEKVAAETPENLQSKPLIRWSACNLPTREVAFQLGFERQTNQRVRQTDDRRVQSVYRKRLRTV